jgi:PAS domain S-box-containing protein
MKTNPTGTDPPSGAPHLDLVHLHEKVVAMNEALILSSVHQHELTEAAEKLNARLRVEISQREKVEAALRESEERFRTLFTSAPMAVFACDLDGVVQQYNAHAAELWGREPICGEDRFFGSIRLWLPDGTLLRQEQSPMAEVQRTGLSALDVEVAIERPDGSRLPALANFAPLKNGDGRITGAITSFIDLTERKKLEQQSLRSQRMESIGTLAGGIAHDLNNSLGPIMMSLELLRMKFADSDSQELIGLLEASAQRGADMVRQVLSFARGVEGRRAEVPVPPLIREIEKIVNETFLRHIQIQTRVPTDVWTVKGDSTQLHQVLLNLCLNARDAMPNGGVLVVAAENRRIGATFAGLSQNPNARPGSYVVVEVKDSGTGMTPTILENIFDPFFTTKEFGKGSGLGLSTSLAIVKSHGGFFHVESEQGKGTTFQVFIPAQTGVASPITSPPVSERLEGHGELILVVDDEEPMRRMTQQILEAFGYHVVLACDGAEAVAIYGLRGAEIAAVITDMTMPVMEGPEAIRILRTMHPNLPIIGASGLASGNYAGRLARLGVKHFLSKPYTTSELLKMVRQALEVIGPAGKQQAPSVLS